MPPPTPMQALSAVRVHPSDYNGKKRGLSTALLFTVVLAFSACAFMDEQVGVSSAMSCVRKSCRDPNAADYSQCEAACRAQYGQ